MKWRERHDPTIRWACLIGVGIIVAAFLIAPLVLAAKSLPRSCTSMSGIEPRFLTHKMDGDTISLFSFPHRLIKFRVQGVNTPERGQPGWAEAGAFTWKWLHIGPFDLSTCWKPTLDRYEATISRNGETLAHALKSAGHSQ